MGDEPELGEPARSRRDVAGSIGTDQHRLERLDRLGHVAGRAQRAGTQQPRRQSLTAVRFGKRPEDIGGPVVLPARQRRARLVENGVAPGHAYPSMARAAARNAAISSGSLTPGAVSTPEDTSTMCAPVTATASPRFWARRPPDRIHGLRPR